MAELHRERKEEMGQRSLGWAHKLLEDWEIEEGWRKEPNKADMASEVYLIRR